MAQRKTSRRTQFVTLITVTLITLACSNGSPEKMMASAKDYLEKGDPAAAIIQIKNTLNQQPDLAAARLLLGRALLDSGDPVAAEVELRKAIALKAPVGQATPLLAHAMMMQGQAKKVIEDLAKTPTANADELAELKTVLGQSYVMLDNFDMAQAAFNEALAAKKDHVPAALALARIEAMKGGLADAGKKVDDILAHSPKDADAWHFKGDLQRAGGKFPEALVSYQKVLELKPRATSVHANIIMLDLQDKKFDLATKQLAEMQKTAAKQPVTVYLEALIAFGKKDLPAARKSIEALLKMQPNNPQGLQLAGAIAYQNKSDIQAQEYLAKALQKAPGLDYSRRLLTLSYLRSGQPAKASATLKPVLQGSKTPTAWLTLAGETHMQSGEPEQAAEFFNLAAQKNPDDKKAQTTLALSQMRLGHTEQAFTDLEHIAASDTGVTADMAIIASALRQKDADKALLAIGRLEKKQPNTPLVHNLRGQALLIKKDLGAARKSFEKALAVDASYLPAATNLVFLDLTEKKIDQAYQRYETVLQKDPKNVRAMLALAQLKARTGGNPDDVTNLLKRAVAAAPGDTMPRVALISHLLAKKDKDKARAATEEALAATPNDPQILDIAGQVFQFVGDNNQALAAYHKLTNLLPNNPQPYLRIAEIHLAAKNPQAARESLAKGIAQQPESIPLQRAQIMLDVADKRFDDALAAAKRIEKNQPKEALGYLLEGDIYLSKKSSKEAAAAYAAGLKAAPTGDLAGRLHMAQLQGGQTAEAASTANAWIKAHPDDQAFRLFVADIANQRKDYATAVSHYRALLAVSPKNPVILNNLAWSLGRQNDPQATAYAEEANRLAPNQPAVLDTLGTLYVTQGKIAPGVDLLAKAVSLAPQNPDIRLSYAKALLKAGKKSEAKQALDILAKLGNQFAAHAEVAELSKGL